MRKRALSLILVFVLALSLCVPAMAADVRKLWTDITYRGISIVINDVEIAPCDEKGNSTEPFIMNDTTYLPVRAIAGALGLNVGWEPSTSTVVLASGEEANYGNGNPAKTFNVKHVEITYRGTNISLDGENIPLVNRNGESVEPFIYNGTNYLPLRVVSEALGLSVGWNGATSTVILKGSSDEPAPGPEPTPPTPAELVWVPSYMNYSGGNTGGTMKDLYKLSYEYDSKGRLGRLYSSDGTIDFQGTYDSQDRLSSAKFKMPGVNESYQWYYDDEGNVEAVIKNGKISEGYYKETDEKGRIIKELYIENGTPVRYEYEYSEDGVLLSKQDIKDGMNRQFKYTYDEQGRISLEEEINDGYSNFHEYSYSEDGRSYVKLENVNNPEYSQRWEYTLDEYGRVIKEQQYYASTGVLGESYEYEYDDDGRVVERLRIADFIREEESFQYDDRGLKIRYEYKNYSGNRDANGEHYYRYTGSFVESWMYDDSGKLIKNCKKNLNPDGSLFDYLEYYWLSDAQGRPTKQFYEGSDGYKYRLTWQYDNSGNVVYEKIEKIAGDSAEVAEYNYTYNGKGNLTKMVYSDNLGNSASEVYTYDHLDRVAYFNTNENGAASKTTLSYDAQNNPIRMETKSYTLGVTVVIDIGYIQVPKAAEDVLVNSFVVQITG